MRRLVFTTELVESAGADTHLQAVSIILVSGRRWDVRIFDTQYSSIVQLLLWSSLKLHQLPVVWHVQSGVNVYYSALLVALLAVGRV